MSRGPLWSELSDRDQTILRLVAEVGVVSATQLQRLAFPPLEGSELSAARRSRRVLARLTDQGLLQRLERRIGGVRAGSAGYLYRLGGQGRRVLGQARRDRRWEPGQRFVDHCLAVAELHVQLVEAHRDGRLAAVTITHEPANWRRFQSRLGVETLAPDLVVECTTTDGWELRWFVEVDRDTEHLPTIVRKAEAYERYWRSGREATVHEVFPRVLWSVPSVDRAAALSRALDGKRGVTSDLHRVAGADETVAVLMTNQETEGGER